MKWWSNKYTYPLVGLAMLTSIGLQAAWLTQLFRAQQVQVKRDLEEVVRNAARKNDYLSIMHGRERSENFRNFFISPQWLLFKQSFMSMRGMGIGMAKFSSDLDKDSAYIDISLRIANQKPSTSKNTKRITHTLDKGQTLASALAADRRDLMRMDSLVKVECLQNGLGVKTNYVLYNYDTGKPKEINAWKAAQQADYRSELYAYNLNFFFHNYQLVVPSIDGLVLYRMRYYLISSFFMLLLTGVAFIFLFRVLRSQRLYTQVRLAFSGNMTHELKTPVAVIEAALDAITRYQLARDPAKLDNYIDISKAQLNRLNQMIDKVLNLEALDNGEILLRPELFDVQEGLENVVTSMRLRNNETMATISYTPSEMPCFVNGDPVHLTNVFYNLVDNAIKYSGAQAKINITCTCNETHVQISFEDNGPGIAKIHRERIFERFFRVPNQADIHNVKGSGLGLHYVKQVIEKHHGQIAVKSEIGKGSNFIISLPAYHEA